MPQLRNHLKSVGKIIPMDWEINVYKSNGNTWGENRIHWIKTRETSDMRAHMFFIRRFQYGRTSTKTHNTRHLNGNEIACWCWKNAIQWIWVGRLCNDYEISHWMMGKYTRNIGMRSSLHCFPCIEFTEWIYLNKTCVNGRNWTRTGDENIVRMEKTMICCEQIRPCVI